MDEVRYQLSLLKAMNQKLSGEERMYRLVCDTSDNAFLYCALQTNEIKTIGKWSDFWDFEVKDNRDFRKIIDEVENDYRIQLEAMLLLEKTGQTKDTLECRLVDGLTWLKIDVDVFYDENNVPLDKVIAFRNITKLKLQNCRVEQLHKLDKCA